MGNKVDLIQEVYSRLYTAQQSGTLTAVKLVRVGSRDEARKLNDLPLINIDPVGGKEIHYAQPNTKVDEMIIEVSLIGAKLDNVNNVFKTSDSSGIMYLFEKVLNALDKTIAGVLDQAFASKANNVPGYEYSINMGDGLIEISTRLTAQSKQFTAGSR